ncbi:hypothetical protein GOODEAATRI_017239 [Goodea atripinnis]|uniref:Uncharacterized protein n=1 Tax=Goodea atripinnis TaxID=208336 RepID=A0ABV0MST1_9TELE
MTSRVAAPDWPVCLSLDLYGQLEDHQDRKGRAAETTVKRRGYKDLCWEDIGLLVHLDLRLNEISIKLEIHRSVHYRLESSSFPLFVTDIRRKLWTQLNRLPRPQTRKA